MWKSILSQILFSYSLLHDNVRMRFPVELPVVWGEFLELHWAGYQCLSANPKAGFLPRVRYLLISTPSAHVPSYAHAIASARITPSAKTTEAKDGKTKGKLELSSSRKCDSVPGNRVLIVDAVPAEQTFSYVYEYRLRMSTSESWKSRISENVFV